MSVEINKGGIWKTVNEDIKIPNIPTPMFEFLESGALSNGANTITIPVDSRNMVTLLLLIDGSSHSPGPVTLCKTVYGLYMLNTTGQVGQNTTSDFQIIPVLNIVDDTPTFGVGVRGVSSITTKTTTYTTGGSYGNAVYANELEINIVSSTLHDIAVSQISQCKTRYSFYKLKK